MPRTTQAILKCAAVALGCSAPMTVHADTLPATAAITDQTNTDATLTQTDDYLVLRQPVAAFLELMAQNRGLRLDVSDRVRGTISDTRLTGTVSEILDNVADAQRLDWFAFNGVVHVSAREEAMTRLIRLGDLSPDDAIKVLDEAGLKLERYPIRATAEESTVAISGPPRMLALVEAVIESVPAKVAFSPPARPGRNVIVRRGITAEQSNTPISD